MDRRLEENVPALEGLDLTYETTYLFLECKALVDKDGLDNMPKVLGVPGWELRSHWWKA